MCSPAAVLADTAYDADALLAYIERRQGNHPNENESKYAAHI
jgi:hypothetical protein